MGTYETKLASIAMTVLQPPQELGEVQPFHLFWHCMKDNLHMETNTAGNINAGNDQHEETKNDTYMYTTCCLVSLKHLQCVV